MKKCIVISGFLLLPALLMSQGLLINTQNRVTTSLNGLWNYITDPYETGYYSFHSEIYDQKNPSSPSAFYNNYHQKNKAELVEYDFDKSPVLKVPGDWNTQKENLFYYEGTIWYKRSFDFNLKENNRLFVYFGGVNYKAEVYLNGIKLGTHEGGFTSFNYEVTSVVKQKNNYLILKVDNRRMKDAVPATNTDWWNYGGITRDVMLIEEPAVFIQDYSIQLKKGTNKTIAGFIKMNGIKKDEKAVISIPEMQVEKEIQLTVDGNAVFEIEAGDPISYWSPESPKLYQVYVKTAYQLIKDEIGFRTIETRGPDILLNGKSVFLRGICMHEEINGRRANSNADAVKLLSLAKELGCNYVRLAHYPHSEYMLRMADKMGLMVWEEIPVYWTIDFTNKSTYLNAQNQLTEVITEGRVIRSAMKRLYQSRLTKPQLIATAAMKRGGGRLASPQATLITFQNLAEMPNRGCMARKEEPVNGKA
ncbi:MAG: beta galactosidase jelly roll domain-containing protein [Chitinophagaceae bacterium]|nr:beta galactosidase jelly roll domain-containing protein [Chitinophagaceae bacterium]